MTLRAEAEDQVDAAEYILTYLEGDDGNPHGQGALVNAVIALAHATLAVAKYTALAEGSE